MGETSRIGNIVKYAQPVPVHAPSIRSGDWLNSINYIDKRRDITMRQNPNM
jgi:hypothetical protein